MADQVVNQSPSTPAAAPGAAPAPAAPTVSTDAASAVASTTSAPSGAISATTADAATSSVTSPAVPGSPPEVSTPSAATATPDSKQPTTSAGTLDAAQKKTALGEAPKPAEAQKPGDAKPEAAKTDATQPAAEAQTGDPAALPTYEPFTLPEGITHDQLDKAGMEAFTKELGQFEVTSKAEHTATQDFANKMMGFHISALKETVQRVNEAWQSQLNQRVDNWDAASKNHPEYGGNRYETSINAANEFMTTHLGTAKQQTEFREMLDETGAGAHPAMLGFLARMNDAYREGKIVPALKPQQQQKLKPYQKAYRGKN